MPLRLQPSRTSLFCLYEILSKENQLGQAVPRLQAHKLWQIILFYISKFVDISYAAVEKNQLVIARNNKNLEITQMSIGGKWISSVQSLSCVWLFATPWTAACQASMSINNSQSSPKPMSIESVMPSDHLILCHALLLLPSIFPSIRVFSNETALRIRWPKYWSFSYDLVQLRLRPSAVK